MNKYKDKPRQTASATPGRGRPRYKIHNIHVYTDVHKPRQQPAGRQVEGDGFGILSKFFILNSKFEILKIRIENLECRF